MPEVHNPTRQELFWQPGQRMLRPGQTVEATESQADATSTAVFVVRRDGRRPTTRPTSAKGTRKVETTEGNAAEER